MAATLRWLPTLYERPSAPGRTGRQMQTWVKFPYGWRVVAAHVSLMEPPKFEILSIA